jgi:endonuclease/exonuclease/phosphatase family metal-dependent hydrolase
MKLTIITSNISADFLSPPGVPPWDERKLLYVDVLRSAEPDIIGLQEVTPRQLEFLQEQFPEFTALTVPVHDPTPDLLEAWQAKYGIRGIPLVPGPYEIILFYRTDALDCLSTGHWWLSPTPDVPSIGFGNIAPRVVLWAGFQHSASNKDMVIFNTHIDQRSIPPMIDVCRRKLSEFTEQYPSLFFIGDLNFNEKDPNYDLLLSDGWKDAHNGFSEHSSDTFLYNRSGIPAGRIDHVFYRSNDFISRTWRRLSPASELRISDHDPVCVEFQTA